MKTFIICILTHSSSETGLSTVRSKVSLFVVVTIRKAAAGKEDSVNMRLVHFS